MQEHVKSAFPAVITESFRPTQQVTLEENHWGNQNVIFFVNWRGGKKEKEKRRVKTQTKKPSLPNLLDNAFCSQIDSGVHFEDLICCKVFEAVATVPLSKLSSWPLT